MAFKGKRLSEEHKRKISIANSISCKGRIISEETRIKISNALKGRHPINELRKGHAPLNWKGGKTIDRHNGYVYIFKPTHPFCKKNGYVLEHRLIMENYIGRYLKTIEVVHHKGIKYPINSIENRSDNRIENLKLFKNKGEHSSFHSKLDKRHIKMLSSKHKENCKCFKCTRIPWNKGLPWPQEIKNKVSGSKKGKRCSPSTEFKKGNPPPKHKNDCKCFRCKKITHFVSMERTSVTLPSLIQ